MYPHVSCQELQGLQNPICVYPVKAQNVSHGMLEASLNFFAIVSSYCHFVAFSILKGG